MATSAVEYNGNLRTTCTHHKSGQEIITDAPTDNNGKGEAFSPTDLVATVYASCMITIIGIHCDKNGHSFENGRAEVTKIMGDAPRRIARLDVALDLSGNGWEEAFCERIKRVAEACPVAQSIHPDIEISITYKF